MLSKAYLTSHSKMSGSRLVITSSWLSGSWRSFLYSSSVYSCHLFLISSASVRSHHFMANRRGNSGNSGWLNFSGLQNHYRWWLQPWNWKMLTPWKESYDQPRQHIKKQRQYFANKDPSSQGYGFSSSHVWMWECWRIDAFDLWCWRRLERVPWTARRSNQSILKEISPEYSLEGLMLKLKLQSFDHLWKTDSFVKTLMLEKIGGRRRRGQQRMRWLDGITDSMDMSLNRLRSWWRTRRPSVLQSMGPQRVGHNWLTELNWKFVQVFIQSYRKIWMNFLANPLFQM